MKWRQYCQTVGAVLAVAGVGLLFAEWSRGSATFHPGVRYAAWAALAAGIPLAVVGYLGEWRRALLVAGGAMAATGLAVLFGDWLKGEMGGGESYYATHVAGIGGLAAGIAVVALGLMPDKLLTIFTIPELQQKILITLLFLAIYRIGYFVPLPFVDQEEMVKHMQGARGALGQLFGYVSMLGGGNASQSTIFALGIMPYISASIILQLLSSFWAPLEKLKKEGESGQKKINEYTRYLTVGICLFQAMIPLQTIFGGQSAAGQGSLYLEGFNTGAYWASGMITLTAGTVFLMWLGEQIDEYGIGNGISLIIMAGIVARIPDATGTLLFAGPGDQTDSFFHLFKQSVFTLGGSSGRDVTFEKLVVLVLLFVGVVVAVIAITKGQRRIPTQSAKHVRGRRVYGGTRQFLPLRLNQSGVMPVIFASSLLIIPGWGFNMLSHTLPDAEWARFMSEAFLRQGGFLYNLCYIGLIYFFCYFWTAIIFNPKEMANNLKEYGSFIPGYRPGKRTAEYLERVMGRITYVGAAFLAVIAVIPTIMSSGMEIPWQVAQFYGGTGLLIVISVALDLVQKINSHLVMRNYQGLTED